jgi:hypothetical protein
MLIYPICWERRPRLQYLAYVLLDGRCWVTGLRIGLFPAKFTSMCVGVHLRVSKTSRYVHIYRKASLLLAAVRLSIKTS